MADVKDEKQATAFQLLPLGVPAEELKLRSQNLSSSIKYSFPRPKQPTLHNIQHGRLARPHFAGLGADERDSALQTTIADEAEETETESEKKEETRDKEQLHDAMRGRSDTTLAKLTEVRVRCRVLCGRVCASSDVCSSRLDHLRSR